jgi:hypothetical protein
LFFSFFFYFKDRHGRHQNPLTKSIKSFILFIKNQLFQKGKFKGIKGRIEYYGCRCIGDIRYSYFGLSKLYVFGGKITMLCIFNKLMSLNIFRSLNSNKSIMVYSVTDKGLKILHPFVKFPQTFKEYYSLVCYAVSHQYNGSSSYLIIVRDKIKLPLNTYRSLFINLIILIICLYICYNVEYSSSILSSSFYINIYKYFKEYYSKGRIDILESGYGKNKQIKTFEIRDTSVCEVNSTVVKEIHNLLWNH